MQLNGHSPRHREHGATLIELLVVMVLMGIVGGMVTTSIVQALQRQTAITERLDALHELELASQRATRDLRAANPLVFAADTDPDRTLTARVERAGQTLDVTYALEELDDGSRVLVQTVREADAIASQRQLVTQVRDDATAIFRYLDVNGDVIECSGAAACLEAYRGAHAVALRLERLVRNQEAVVVENLINIRNVRFGGS